jgi:molybdenum cofactor cytidylyltransferase
MRLSEAFGIKKGDLVAFTGAGGKTSALLRLGNELSSEGWRVLAATTAPAIAMSEIARLPGTLALGKSSRPAAVARALDRLSEQPLVFLYSEQVGDRALGLDPELIDALIDAVDSDVMLLEADNARGKPFKAPYINEPFLPAGTSLVIPTVGLDALGQPLDDDHFYNTNAMIDQFGYLPGDRLKAPWIASVLRDEDLGLKDIPANARIAGLINKVPSHGYPRGRARLIAQLMLRSTRIQCVALGSVQMRDPIHEVQRRVGAIVLAGGMSSRMGELKVLLPWDGRPVLSAIVQRLHTARVDTVMVVTGHHAAQVRAVSEKAGAQSVYNPDYQAGEMLSSLQAGLRAFGPEISACLLVLGDQPQLDPRVIGDLLSAYAEGDSLIVVPHFQRRRGHPILIDRALWPELLNLPADGTPRDLIRAHEAETTYVESATDSILRDIDTPEDYARERRLAGLE